MTRDDRILKLQIKLPIEPLIPLEQNIDEIKQQTLEVIESGICEPSRLYHMLSMIGQGKSLYKSDLVFLQKMKELLDKKAQKMQEENKEIHYNLQRPAPGVGIGRIEHSETMINEQGIDDLIARHNKQQHKRKNVTKQDVLTN